MANPRHQAIRDPVDVNPRARLVSVSLPRQARAELAHVFRAPGIRYLAGWVLLAAAAITTVAVPFFATPGAPELHAEVGASSATSLQVYFSDDESLSEVDSAVRSVPAGAERTLRIPAPDPSIMSMRIDPAPGSGGFTICKPRIVQDAETLVALHPLPITGSSDVAVVRLDGACTRLVPRQGASDPQVAVSVSFLAPTFERSESRTRWRHCVGAVVVLLLAIGGWLCWKPSAIYSRAEVRLSRLTRRIALLYLALAIPLGSLYAIATPPGAVPDEPAHIAKAIAVENGHWWGRPDNGALGPSLSNVMGPFGNFLDTSQSFTASQVLRHAAERLQCTASTEHWPQSAMSYAPFGYLAPGAVLNVVCGLGLTKGFFLYGGRLINLLLAVGLVALGLHTAGNNALPLLVAATFPMVLFEQSSMTADSLLLGTTLCMLGVQVGLAKGSVAPRARYEFLLIALGLVLAFSKPGFAWTCVGYLFCLPAYIRAGIRFWPRFAWIVGLPWLLHIAWAFMAVGDAQPLAGVDPARNLRMIVDSPTVFGGLLWTTFLGEGSAFLWTSVIGRLGWLDVPLHNGSYSALIALMMLALASSSEKPQSNRLAVVIPMAAIAIGFAAMLLPTLPMYLYWTGVGAPRIEGLQGRYFIPSLAFVLVWAAFRAPAAVRAISIIAVPVGAVLCILDGALRLAWRYYA